MPDARIIPMPVKPSERERHAGMGELIMADKARHVVYARAIEQWKQPGTPLQQAVDKFFVVVAIAGGCAGLYFIAHQVAVWAQ